MPRLPRFLFLVAAVLPHISGAYDLAIVSMFRNEAPYLKEWVEYHALAGVGHFWLFNDRSTDNWQEVLKPFIDQGLVEVTHWPTPEGGSWVTTQVRAFREGLRRAKGKADWVAFIDLDEFLLPMQGKSLPECLETNFWNASGVHVNWRNFGTSNAHLAKAAPILSRLTGCSEAAHSENSVGKSIVRPEHVDLVNLWSPHHAPLTSGHFVDGDGQAMTFRGTDLPTDGRHHERFIRVNHYPLRDENFYKYVRMRKANRGFGNKDRLIEHHDSFSKTTDRSIIDFIQLRKGSPKSDDQSISVSPSHEPRCIHNGKALRNRSPLRPARKSAL